MSLRFLHSRAAKRQLIDVYRFAGKWPGEMNFTSGEVMPCAAMLVGIKCFNIPKEQLLKDVFWLDEK